MSASQSDRNVLFGVLALQMEFITQAGLIAALQAWTLQKSRPLGELLVELGHLSADDRAALEPMVDRHVARHGGSAEQSLAALSSVSDVAAELRELNDADVQQSLAHVAAPREAGQRSRLAPQDEPNAPPTPDSSIDDDLPELQPTFVETQAETPQPAMRFLLLRPHAEGGLGKVWIARDRELNRDVAFKEIKAKRAQDKNSRGRFVLEAEITGGLEHPGIVPVYGLGHFADGRPFYAMRFIRGHSLQEAIKEFHQGIAQRSRHAPRDEPNASHARSADSASNKSTSSPASARHAERDGYVDGERGIAFRKLIQRLIDVCNAIAYAHSRGVLHRDLKPGNIMLGKYGETLVVDWGLAKAKGQTFDPAANATGESSLDQEPSLSPSKADDVAATQMGSAIGTPKFMSPEQAAGRLDLLGPASDVYSLGATLYELLTGQAPIGARPGGESERLTIPEVLRRVEQGNFPAPRCVLPSVPAPLEAVCLRAMSRDPHARYATAQALAEDLERWLADEPVSVYREPLPVRLRRFVRRHQVAVTSLAAAIVVALVGLGVLSAVVSNSNQRLNSANATITAKNEALRQTNEQLTTANNTIRDQNSAITAKNEELRTTNSQLAAARTEAEQKREEAEANAKVASEQSRLAMNTLLSVLTNLQRGIANMPGAAEIRQRLLATVIKNLDQVSRTYVAQTTVDRSTKLALDQLGDMILEFGSVASGMSSQPPAQSTGTRVSGDPNVIFTHVETAERLYQQAFTIAQRLAKDQPGDALAQQALVDSFNNLGKVSLRFGRNEDARSQFEAGLKISRALANNNPNDIQVQRALSASLDLLGTAHERLGQNDVALQRFEESLKISRTLSESNPSDSQSQHELAVSFERLGNVFLKLNRAVDALSLFEESLKISRSRAEADPEDTQKQRGLWIAHQNLGNVLVALGREDDAYRHYLSDLQIRARLADADLRNASRQFELMWGHHNLALRLKTVGDFVQSREQFSAAIRVLDRLIANGQQVEAAKGMKSLVERNIRLVQDTQLAVGDWDTLLKADAKVLPQLFILRATEMLKRGELAAAVQAADKLREFDAKNKTNLYNAACVYARCAEFVTKDKPAPTDAEQAERKKFIDLALACLKESLAAGWDDFEHMQKDNDLKPLRSLPEFESLFPKMPEK